MGTDFDLETVDRLLSTTRAVRRRLDLARPVERSVIQECIALSQQAPTASNQQTWRWIVVTDAGLRREIAAIYSSAIGAFEASRKTTGEKDAQTGRVYDSAAWLFDHLAEVPVHVLPCVIGRPPQEFSSLLNASIYGSILPAVWSFQLALRSRGLGSTLTTIHLLREQDMAKLLGVPADVLQVALLPVAYTQGTGFKPATRPPAESITSWDRWDRPDGS